MLRVAASAVSSGRRCAYCHGDLLTAPRGCAGCATVLHDDCWRLAGACPTRGCSGSPDDGETLSLGAWVFVNAYYGVRWLREDLGLFGRIIALVGLFGMLALIVHLVEPLHATCCYLE